LKDPNGVRKHRESTQPNSSKTGQLFFFLLSSFFFRRSPTTTVKILQDLFAAEVGVGMTMAAFGISVPRFREISLDLGDLMVI